MCEILIWLIHLSLSIPNTIITKSVRPPACAIASTSSNSPASNFSTAPFIPCCISGVKSAFGILSPLAFPANTPSPLPPPPPPDYSNPNPCAGFMLSSLTKNPALYPPPPRHHDLLLLEECWQRRLFRVVLPRCRGLQPRCCLAAQRCHRWPASQARSLVWRGRLPCARNPSSSDALAAKGRCLLPRRNTNRRTHKALHGFLQPIPFRKPQCNVT